MIEGKKGKNFGSIWSLRQGLAKFFIIAPLSLILLSSCDNGEDIFYGYAEGNIISISSEETGAITEITIKEGEGAKKDQHLFTIDQSILESSVSLAKAQLEAATSANLKLLDAKQSSAIIDSLNARIKGAESSQKLAQINFDRSANLFKSNAIAQTKLDDARNALYQADAYLADLEAQKFEASSSARDADVAISEANKKAAAANLEIATKRLERAKIYAPFAGEVIEIIREEGEVVGAGSVVMRFIKAGYREVIFYVPEHRLGSFNINDEIKVFCNSCDEGGLKARVKFISFEPEYTPPVIYSNNESSDLVFAVKADIEESNKILPKIGQPVSVKF